MKRIEFAVFGIALVCAINSFGAFGLEDTVESQYTTEEADILFGNVESNTTSIAVVSNLVENAVQNGSNGTVNLNLSTGSGFIIRNETAVPGIWSTTLSASLDNFYVDVSGDGFASVSGSPLAVDPATGPTHALNETAANALYLQMAGDEGTNAVIAEAVRIAGGAGGGDLSHTNAVIIAASNAVAQTLGTMAAEDAADYAGVIDRVYNVARPAGYSDDMGDEATFDPPEHRQTLFPIAFTALAPTTITGRTGIPVAYQLNSTSGSIQWWGANKNTRKIGASFYWDPASISTTNGTKLKIDYYSVVDDAVGTNVVTSRPLDSSYNATNGTLTLVVDVPPEHWTNITHHVRFWSGVPLGDGATVLNTQGYLLDFWAIERDDTANTLGTLLLDSGATEL